MACGKLAVRIAWVLVEKGRLTRATLFTLPKPRVHLFCLLVRIMLEGGIGGGGGLH